MQIIVGVIGSFSYIGTILNGSTQINATIKNLFEFIHKIFIPRMAMKHVIFLVIEN